MKTEELVNRFADLVAAIERIADALENIRANYDEVAGKERLYPPR